MLRRDVLAVPPNVFDFVRKCEGQEVPWWPVAWGEFRAMRDLLPLMYADLGPLFRGRCSPLMQGAVPGWLVTMGLSGLSGLPWGRRLPLTGFVGLRVPCVQFPV